MTLGKPASEYCRRLNIEWREQCRQYRTGAVGSTLFGRAWKELGMRHFRLSFAAVAMTGALITATAAHAADAVADFYRGRTVQVIVGYGPGRSEEHTSELQSH